jgi:hypothetical protein
VRVLEVGGELDLGQEALGPDHGRKLGAEHLDRDRPVVPEVVRQEDGRHAAGADLAIEPIAVRQRGLEPRDQVGHVVAGREERCRKMARRGGLG